MFNKEEKIWTVFNKKEDTLLKKKLSLFDFSKHTKKQINDLVLFMRKMMIKNKGVGLSANQVGLNMSVFVCQLPSRDGKGYVGKFYAIFNPKIEEKSKKEISDNEGCLSIPGYYGAVKRAERITILGFDKNQRPLKIKADGFLARIFQHEIDHLNGRVFADKAETFEKTEE